MQPSSNQKTGGTTIKKSNSKFNMQEDEQNLYRVSLIYLTSIQPEFAASKEDKNKGTKEKMWELMSTYLPSDKATI